jgi:natural product precursor
MKTIKKIILNDAKLLTTDEMKHLFGGSGSSRTKCVSEGKSCTLYIPDHNRVLLPYSGECKTLRSGAWIRCACVVSEYSSDPSKPSHACQ